MIKLRAVQKEVSKKMNHTTCVCGYNTITFFLVYSLFLCAKLPMKMLGKAVNQHIHRFVMYPFAMIFCEQADGWICSAMVVVITHDIVCCDI